MAEDSGAQRIRLFKKLLGQFPPGKLIDLGAGHGKFAIMAAKAGWDVTAVDARDERFPDYPGVRWQQQDIREVQLSGYDLILNLGLFYHLAIGDQLDLLDRSAGTPMILDTRFAIPDDKGFRLSEPVRRRGYRGRLYSEAEIQHVATASFGNLDSFWPTPRALHRMLNERGWDVFTLTPYYLPSRIFFLCLPR